MLLQFMHRSGTQYEAKCKKMKFHNEDATKEADLLKQDEMDESMNVPISSSDHFLDISVIFNGKVCIMGEVRYSENLSPFTRNSVKQKDVSLLGPTGFCGSEFIVLINIYRF